MAKRLIDADELKKRLYKSTEWTHGEHPMILEETDIDNAPTVSAVEVVKCENCKNWNIIKERKHLLYSEIELPYPGKCKLLKRETKWNDYCSYSEKESEGK